jgi:conjugal transfer/entry exclusion protein
MARVLAVSLLGVLLALPSLSTATGLPVVDVDAGIKLLLQYKQQLVGYLESVKQTAYQVQQIENQVRQITGMYTQIEQAAKHLMHLDLNHAADLLGMARQLESKLAQAEYIGSRANSRCPRRGGLYPRIQGSLTAAEQRRLTLQWAAMRRDAAQVAISTQAIREAQARYQQQWADILRRAYAAQGALQIQQAGVQAQGVMGHQLLGIEQQLATQARERSEQAMETASRAEIEQHLLQQAMEPLSTAYTPQGRFLPMPRTGRE